MGPRYPQGHLSEKDLNAQLSSLSSLWDRHSAPFSQGSPPCLEPQPRSLRFNDAQEWFSIIQFVARMTPMPISLTVKWKGHVCSARPFYLGPVMSDTFPPTCKEPEAGVRASVLPSVLLSQPSFRGLGGFPALPRAGFEGSPIPFSAAPPCRMSEES